MRIQPSRLEVDGIRFTIQATVREQQHQQISTIRLPEHEGHEDGHAADTAQRGERKVDLVEDLLEVRHVVNVVDQHSGLAEERHTAGGRAHRLDLTTRDSGAHHGAGAGAKSHGERLAGQGSLVALREDIQHTKALERHLYGKK